jgi:hypothetical protein
MVLASPGGDDMYVRPRMAAYESGQPPSTVPLMTRWAKQVTPPDHVLPEYPRPELVRREWLNLNGRWEYAIRDRDAERPATFDGAILVPFPVQSRLSGVARAVKETERLWYRRALPVRPRASRRWLLHFGAVDWEAVAWVNGRQVGEHRGGYDPFTVDITDALRPAADQELVLAVWDPTDRGDQPRGKQVLEPKSIWYTAVTGIWQTVWLEPVPTTYISEVHARPEPDAGLVHVRVAIAGPRASDPVRLSITDGTRVVAEGAATANETAALRIPDAHLWSPADPHLYGIRISHPNGDTVESYFGIRKMAVQRDASGVLRLFLNGKPLFEYGLLDQGWWPDGLYTAPSDEALRSDIETTKRLGFNLIRKHVKVEPSRWYYHCDRIGVLVWQDMPSANNATQAGKEDFTREIERIVDTLDNHPAIVMWVPFNEGWGQHDTARYVDWLHKRDPTRLVDNASGWNDEHVGDVLDVHSYPGPAVTREDERRASVLGEFGGLGLPLEGHTWLDKGNWGYRTFTGADALGRAYRDLQYQLRIMSGERLAAAVYTQTTDVEIEVNGIMTYDRAVVKLPDDAPALHARLYQTPPAVRTVVPSSDPTPQLWRYTTGAPPGNWFQRDFDDAAWQSGSGPFVSQPPAAGGGTVWDANDIWLRRRVEIETANLVAPHVRVARDGDVDVYVNGTAVELPGTVGNYFFAPVPAATFNNGWNVIAVHAHRTRKTARVDVGVADVVEVSR